MAAAQTQQGLLTAEQTKVVLAEVLKALGSPDSEARLQEARESACNDMGKMLQFVLPVATQIQQEVIKSYGFSNDGEGVLKFARLVKVYETQDPEIAAMSLKLKSLFLPPMTAPPLGEESRRPRDRGRSPHSSPVSSAVPVSPSCPVAVTPLALRSGPDISIV